MSVVRQALHGSLLLTLGEGVVYGCSFARNMILARTLTKADFGIAATLSLILTLLEMSDKLGMARFVVRDRDGNDPEFIAAAHVVHLAVAVLSAGLIALCAGPLGLLFGIVEHRTALLMLALSPLFRGLEHLDVRRFERDLRFGPSLLVEAVPQVLITLAAWPLTALMADYRAVLVLLLTKGLVSCAASHVLAERRYRWRYHREYIRRMLRFGWPLVLNGILMFGVLQGDQFLVAARYGMADVASYAAAAALTMAPTFFFARVFNSLMLPILAKVQDEPVAFVRRYREVLALVTMFAVFSSLATILGAESLIRLVYGGKYAGTGALLAWLASANAFRNVRIAPALAAIARGDSHNQLISNVWRVVSLLPAAGLAVGRAPLWTIACTGLLGEALACWVSYRRLNQSLGISLIDNLRSTVAALIAVSAAGVAVTAGFHNLPAQIALPGALLSGIAGAAGTALALPTLWRQMGDSLGQWRDSSWRAI